MAYLMAAVLAVLVGETWLLWRALSRLGVLTRVDDRLERLSHTVLLLTDATETCFKVIAGQLEPAAATLARANAPAKKPALVAETPLRRTGRQRRVVGAARRGRSAMEIAATEEVAESEVRLRLHLADQDDIAREAHRGALRS